MISLENLVSRNLLSDPTLPFVLLFFYHIGNINKECKSKHLKSVSIQNQYILKNGLVNRCKTWYYYGQSKIKTQNVHWMDLDISYIYAVLHIPLLLYCQVNKKYVSSFSFIKCKEKIRHQRHYHQRRKNPPILFRTHVFHLVFWK